MLKKLPPTLKGILVFTVILVHTCLCAVPIYLIMPFKLLLTSPKWQARFARWIIAIAEYWIAVNARLFAATQQMDWTILGDENLQYGGWYLVASNHVSTADIFVLQTLFNRRIPFLKFFVKHQLIYVPIMGLIWWAMDYPFMRRYTKAYLAQHPEKRGQDLATTRQKAEKFKYTPVSIINFLEGTRITPAKYAEQRPSYRYLLQPKAGGIAYITSVLGERLNTLLDVTIIYPTNESDTLHFWDFLCGRVTRIVVHINQITIPPALFAGNYMDDEAFRGQFQAWVSNLWAAKDERIADLRQQYGDECHTLAKK